MIIVHWITKYYRDLLSKSLLGGPFYTIPPCCAQKFLIPDEIVERIEHLEISPDETNPKDPNLIINCPGLSEQVFNNLVMNSTWLSEPVSIIWLLIPQD